MPGKFPKQGVCALMAAQVWSIIMHIFKKMVETCGSEKAPFLKTTLKPVNELTSWLLGLVHIKSSVMNTFTVIHLSDSVTLLKVDE